MLARLRARMWLCGRYLQLTVLYSMPDPAYTGGTTANQRNKQHGASLAYAVNSDMPGQQSHRVDTPAGGRRDEPIITGHNEQPARLHWWACTARRQPPGRPILPAGSEAPLPCTEIDGRTVLVDPARVFGSALTKRWTGNKAGRHSVCTHCACWECVRGLNQK